MLRNHYGIIKMEILQIKFTEKGNKIYTIADLGPIKLFYLPSERS
jgi:hypothetical protein